jgi:Tat protein translocase TatB subunit
VLALILETLGSTELIFILVVALMFFGPRKLPQLSRSLGKSLAEFRKASEDFKRTWEREVELESARTQEENTAQAASMIQQPSVMPISRDQVIAPDSSDKREPYASDAHETVETPSVEPFSKRDWL